MGIEIEVPNEAFVAVRAAERLLRDVGDTGNVVDDVGRVRLVRLGELWPFLAQVDEADVVLQADFGAELVAAALVVGPLLEPGARELDLAADEAEALVRGADVDVEVGLFGEFLVAARVGAGHRLAVLDRLARVVDLNVRFQLPERAGFVVAEQAVLVLLPHVRLQLRIGGEADAMCRAVFSHLRGAFHAPVLERAVFPLPMSIQRALGVECR